MTTAISASGSTQLDPLEDQEQSLFGIRRSSWLKVVTVVALFALLFWPNLRRLWDKTNPFTGEPNWSHAIFIPLVGLYYLWVNREHLRAAKVKPAWSGLGIALFGILFFGYGIYPGQNDWFKDIGMVIALFGIVTLLCGWEVMRIAWFPIIFLFCALPWPGLLYSKVAGPLQELAAGVAVKTLQVANVEAFRFGTKIIMVGNHNAVRTLNVAEACAGLRSLMTFVSLAAMLAFLSARPLWAKIVMVVTAVPIAIFCNVMRVSGQGLLDRYVSQQLSESFAHQFVGVIMLIPAFFLILLVGWILQNLFIDEVDDKAALKTKVVRARTGATATAQASTGAKPQAAEAQATPVAQTHATLPPRPAIANRPAMTLPPRPKGLAGDRNGNAQRAPKEKP